MNKPNCSTCHGAGWITLAGPDTVRACCPFCNKNGQRPDLRPLVVDIFERREYSKCWFADGDCGNWTECNPDCSLVKLRELAGIEPTEDGTMSIARQPDGAGEGANGE
jgi:hypothetical protein